MSAENDEPIRPPEAPPFTRSLRLDRPEKIGVPLLLLLPLLALYGMFDEQEMTTTAAATGVEMQVIYPSRSRHQLEGVLEIHVRNSSVHALPVLTLGIDRNYLAHFDQVRFLPLPIRIDGETYQVEFRDLQPGETRRLNIELRPDDPGRHTGRITARGIDGSQAETTISSIIFP